LARAATGDPAAIGGELNRVVDQIREDLPQLVAVGLGVERLVGQVDHEVVAVGAGCLRGQLDHVRHDRPDIGRRQVDLQVAGVEARDVEELVDDRRQAV
jgi:hypothetical protein